MYLGATVIQYLDVSTKSLVHDVYRNIITVCQVPQKVEDLVGHYPILIILSQAPDKFQQFFALLLASICPACLYKSKSKCLRDSSAFIKWVFKLLTSSKEVYYLVSVLHSCLLLYTVWQSQITVGSTLTMDKYLI